MSDEELGQINGFSLGDLMKEASIQMDNPPMPGDYRHIIGYPKTHVIMAAVRVSAAEQVVSRMEDRIYLEGHIKERLARELAQQIVKEIDLLIEPAWETVGGTETIFRARLDICLPTI